MDVDRSWLQWFPSIQSQTPCVSSLCFQGINSTADPPEVKFCVIYLNDQAKPQGTHYCPSYSTNEVACSAKNTEEGAEKVLKGAAMAKQGALTDETGS